MYDFITLDTTLDLCAVDSMIGEVIDIIFQKETNIFAFVIMTRRFPVLRTIPSPCISHLNFSEILLPIIEKFLKKIPKNTQI